MILIHNLLPMCLALAEKVRVRVRGMNDQPIDVEAEMMVSRLQMMPRQTSNIQWRKRLTTPSRLISWSCAEQRYGMSSETKVVHHAALSESDSIAMQAGVLTSVMCRNISQTRETIATPNMAM